MRKLQNEIKAVEKHIDNVQAIVRELGKVVREDHIYQIMEIDYDWVEYDNRVLYFYNMFEEAYKEDELKEIADYVYQQA